MSLIYNLGRSEISEEGAQALLKDLESCIKTFENMNDILKASQSNGISYLETELYKKIEDGILDSIHNASKHQLNIILNGGYKFKFYTEAGFGIYYQRLEIKCAVWLRQYHWNQRSQCFGHWQYDPYHSDEGY